MLQVQQHLPHTYTSGQSALEWCTQKRSTESGGQATIFRTLIPSEVACHLANTECLP